MDLLCEAAEAAVAPYSASPRGQFHSNCFHAFIIHGDAYIVCGAYSSLQDQLTNRMHLYSLEDMVWYSADGSDDEYLFGQVTYNGQWCNGQWCTDSGAEAVRESAIPEPDWQQEMTWPTESGHACMASHGSLVARQTSEHSSSVVDLVSHAELVHLSFEESASSPDSVITGLQWSSSGDLLALQYADVASGCAQLMLMETERWQRMASCDYSPGFSIARAPNKPTLGVNNGMIVEVRPELMI